MGDRLRGMQLAVEAPAGGVLLVRVAGRLTAETGPRLLRLVDGLLGRDDDARPRTARLVVDLGNVWVYDAEGVTALDHARHSASRRGVRFVLDGVDAVRLDLLPRRIELALRRLGIAPTPPALPAPRAAGGVLAVP